MTNAIFRRTMVGAAVVAALGVLAAPAGAAPYRGTFDPTDFAGEYIIDVDPTCLSTMSGWQANVGLCAATLVSAVANVVSTNDPSSTTPPNYTGTLTFAPPNISSPSVLFGIYIYGGAIDGFDTVPIAHQTASPSTVDNWWIQFVSGHMPPPCDPYCYTFSTNDVQPEGVGPLGRGVYLFANTLDTPVASAVYLGPAQAIPEPGTLGLALGALGGGWLASRRRRKESEKDSS